jgi:hypothetical protein
MIKIPIDGTISKLYIHSTPDTQSLKVQDVTNYSIMNVTTPNYFLPLNFKSEFILLHFLKKSYQLKFA